MKRTYFTLLIASVTAILIAQAPAGYYDSANGKADTQLRLALNSIIYNHTDVGYNGLWAVYATSDVQNGKVLDIYSNCDFTFSSGNQCGNYTTVCDCYNREHSVPQSWFGGASPMYSDAFHLYPTDGRVNGQRSNYPYGECSGGTSLGVKALGRLGGSTFTGYSGTVFEPDDQYKGDLARTYFYMATCYANQNFISGEGATVFVYNSSSNPKANLTAYAINLFLKWSRNDPVSQKEIDRNNAIYAAQKNRNPFIDHPELAEYIWGNKVGYVWNVSSQTDDIEAIDVRIIYNRQSSSIQIICEQTFDSFAIINLSGQTVESGTITGDFIPINQLTDGLYFVVLNSNLGRITQKLLVY